MTDVFKCVNDEVDMTTKTTKKNTRSAQGKKESWTLWAHLVAHLEVDFSSACRSHFLQYLS